MSDCVNAALFIALQCRATACAWGSTGVGKNAILEAFARAIGYTYHCFIPSMHLPEDIGGALDIDRKAQEGVLYPMRWISSLKKPNQLLHIDEATTAPQPMRPPILSIANERRVGDVQFHESTIIVLAANPPELAPNSSPLEASMLNRLYHHEWEVPFDSWYAGMMNGGKFPTPDNFPVVGDYGAYLPKWTALIGRLCYRSPALRETKRAPEDEKAFPSIRMWEKLAHCLAGADKVKASTDVYSQLATGMVGSNAASQLMRWLAAADLYDANAVLDGSVKVEYGEDRIDQLIYLPCGILDALKDDHSGKRLDRATEVLIEMGENGMLDNVMPVMGEMSRTYPKYRVSQKLLGRYGAIIKQIGGGN